MPESEVVELGGANSCIYDSIAQALQPHTYHVVDSNALGLDLMRRRCRSSNVHLHQEDVRNLQFTGPADVVLSVDTYPKFCIPNEFKKNEYT
jgi:hypothetical protein